MSVAGKGRPTPHYGNVLDQHCTDYSGVVLVGLCTSVMMRSSKSEKLTQCLL